MKSFILSCLIFPMVFATSAQTKKPDLVTDRPDQTESPVLVPMGALQIEIGFMRQKDHAKSVEQIHYIYNTTLIKYAVNENLELRLINQYLGDYYRLEGNKISQISGLGPVALGVKIKIADSRGFLPRAALIGHINVKSGAKAFKPDYTAADFRFTFAHTITNKFSIGYNVGAQWNGKTPEAAFLYTLSAGYSITDDFVFFVESYGFFPENKTADHRIDGGLTYKITPIIQFDFSAGLGLTANAPDSFLGTGLSFRLVK